METVVIKGNGAKELFDIEKVRSAVRKAAEEANLEDERIEEVVEETSQATLELAKSEKEVETSALRDEILATLDTLEPSVSEAWRNYDEKRGKM